MAKRMAVTLLIDVGDDDTKEGVAARLAGSIENKGVFTDTPYMFVSLEAVGEHEAAKRMRVKPKTTRRG